MNLPGGVAKKGGGGGAFEPAAPREMRFRARFRVRERLRCATRDLDSYRSVGPFVFNKTDYWQDLNMRATALSSTDL
jgi:hypothetical protein